MATQPPGSGAATGPSSNVLSHSLNASVASHQPLATKLGANIGKFKAARRFPLKKFTYFKKLPIELQMMVWNFSLEPRFLEMRFANNYTSTQFDVLADIPAVLHVNRDVRAVYRKHYKVLFLHKKCRAPAYFCEKINALHIRSAWSFRQLIPTIKILPNKSRIRHVSITPAFFLQLWFGTSVWHGSKISPLLLFLHLKTVSVSIINQHCEDRNPSIWRTGPSRSHITTLSYPFRDYEQASIEECQNDVRQFIDQWESGRWAGVTWKMPNFEYKALCLKSINPKKMYCPPLGLERAQRKKEVEEELDWKQDDTNQQLQWNLNEREK
ncbi:hypothetical protein IFR05_003706 [Cadophora sp. M221]|nr:hypothetical protein IFR05_003706 [Cadophora sp. M221]